MERPLQVYCNWAAYDELSDNVQLTEAVAMRQHTEMRRLRALGVRLDAHLMDCFWYDNHAGYRRWREPHFQDQGQSWLDACARDGVMPGIWIGSNSRTTARIDAPGWEASRSRDGSAHCCFHGPFLDDLDTAMRDLHARGVRLFKLDFLDQLAAPAAIEEVLLPSEIRAANTTAFRRMLARQRRDLDGFRCTAYNGFDEMWCQHATDLPQRRTMDRRWLDAVDWFYPGDPRPADLPAASLWRSKDVYTDHMVRWYHAQGLPLTAIDNAGFMVGRTGTCYQRGAAGWQASAILALARGGGMTMWYGDLSLLDDAAGLWLAELQGTYLGTLAGARTDPLGAMPGTGAAYGWWTRRGADALVACVNPGLRRQELRLPAGGGRLVFCDAGAEPDIAGDRVVLPPGQMALIAWGACAALELGRGDGESVPADWQPLASGTGAGAAEIAAVPPAGRGMLAVMTQRDRSGRYRRADGGGLADRQPMHRVLPIIASQDGREIAGRPVHDRKIWSGTSWGALLLAPGACRTDRPLRIAATGSSAEFQVEVQLLAAG